MPEINIVQLKDKDKNPVSPYIPASAVYVRVNGEDTNMENMLAGVNVSAVTETYNGAIEDINKQRDESVEKVRTEGDSYRRDIDALQEEIKVLDGKVFPLNISASIIANFSTMKYSYTYRVTEYGGNIDGLSVNLSKTTTGGSNTLYNGTLSENSISTDIAWGLTTFKINATKGSKASSRTDKRYVCISCSYGPTINASILTSSIATKQATTNTSFITVVNTTTDRQYIWVAIPNELNITRITSGGFDVTMNTYITITVGGATYKAYRSKNPLQVANWNLIIS